MKSKLYIIFMIALLSCGGDGVSPSSKTSKCGCSKYKKADCYGKCTWTVGKGCGC